jgi:23S rRNA (pseudouridine1915-N3)-methyltransferase
MNINIITLGKLKEEYFKKASAEYEKRLSAYCKVNIIEIVGNAFMRSDKTARSAAERINPFPTKIPKSYKIALCAEGEKFSSESFADKLLKIGQDLSFIIGCSDGLPEDVKNSADLKLSLSDMTFPYQLARIVLLEQIYRAFSINNNGKYHK